jgi:predicted outer membrane protein
MSGTLDASTSIYLREIRINSRRRAFNDQVARLGLLAELAKHQISCARDHYPGNKAVPQFAFAMTLFCLGVTAVGRAADQLPADTDFVRKSEQSANQEIADARDALAMSKDPAILAVAKQIQEDSTVANRQLAALSVEKGWPTPDLDPPDTISRYSDHGYVVRQIHAQQDALTFYAEEAANGADTSLQEFARDKMPTLRQRLVSLKILRTS